jgi:hypothetical protein
MGNKSNAKLIHYFEYDKRLANFLLLAIRRIIQSVGPDRSPRA